MTSEKAIRLGIKTIPISLRNAALKLRLPPAGKLLPREIPISLRNAALKLITPEINLKADTDSYFAA